MKLSCIQPYVYSNVILIFLEIFFQPFFNSVFAYFPPTFPFK